MKLLAVFLLPLLGWSDAPESGYEVFKAKEISAHRTAKGDFVHVLEQDENDPFYFDWFNASPSGTSGKAPNRWRYPVSTISNEGISANQVYSEYGNPTEEVIVAVLDSGVDIGHEDLQGRIWINKGEIPNNGIDDDQNGYIDDVTGWNFLGTSKGSGEHTIDEEGIASFESKNMDLQVNDENLEVTREIQKLLKNENPSDGDKEYLAWLKTIYNGYVSMFGRNHRYVDLEYQNELRAVIEEEIKTLGRYYGNNDVVGPDADHGTHVAGIIAANRFNKIGIEGVASNAKIMPVRVVPNGDEFDRDVANGIRYAVENGAKIINCSFGKSVSPDEPAVEKAIQFARRKGVIIVHSAGNDGRKTSTKDNFPNGFRKNRKKQYKNWIEVGASGPIRGKSLTAYFSNYGPLVDVFAPGVAIASTIPGNKYAHYSGTSMASPVLSGALALLKGHYGKKSMTALAKVLLKSGRSYPDLTVAIGSPRTTDRKFSELSKTGKVIDVYNAMKVLEL